MVTGLLLFIITLFYFQIDKFSEYLLNYNCLSSKVIIDSIAVNNYSELIRWFTGHLFHLSLNDYLINSISLMGQGIVLEKFFVKISKFFFFKLTLLMMLLTSIIYTFLSYFIYLIFSNETYYNLNVSGLSAILLGFQFIYHYLTTRNYYRSISRILFYMIYIYFLVDSNKLVYHLSGLLSGISIVYLIDF